MNRRRFLVGFAGTTASLSAVLGSGAFSGVEAQRLVSVEVADDDDAYLGLRQLGTGGRSVGTGTPERVEFHFPSKGELHDDFDLGLGENSVYEFVYDADEPETDDIKGLLRITNQGTNEVEVFSEHETDSELEIELFDVEDPTRTALRVSRPKLIPGDYLDVGFRIKTFDAALGPHDETLVIVAKTEDTPDP